MLTIPNTEFATSESEESRNEKTVYVASVPYIKGISERLQSAFKSHEVTSAHPLHQEPGKKSGKPGQVWFNQTYQAFVKKTSLVKSLVRLVLPGFYGEPGCIVPQKPGKAGLGTKIIT